MGEGSAEFGRRMFLLAAAAVTVAGSGGVAGRASAAAAGASIVRRGLRAALGADPGITVVGEAATGAEALTQAEITGPDVVLMDLHLGTGMTGAEATRRLLTHPRPPQVLVLTTRRGIIR